MIRDIFHCDIYISALCIARDVLALHLIGRISPTAEGGDKGQPHAIDNKGGGRGRGSV